MADTPWRVSLRPASFRGAQFHVEAAGRTGGRRAVTHEYPKSSTPYTEDLGRSAKRFSVSAYVIGGLDDVDYRQQRDALIAACDAEGPGLLVHPTQGEQLVVCTSCTCSETRQRGNFAELELTFAEAGAAPNSAPAANTASQVKDQAKKTGAAAASAADKEVVSA